MKGKAAAKNEQKRLQLKWHSPEKDGALITIGKILWGTRDPTSLKRAEDSFVINVDSLPTFHSPMELL